MVDDTNSSKADWGCDDDRSHRWGIADRMAELPLPGAAGRDARARRTPPDKPARCWAPDVHFGNNAEPAIDAMRVFVLDFEMTSYDELQFPPAPPDIRRRLHKVARKFNLLSRSVGEGELRRVLVRRRFLNAPAPLDMSMSASRKQIALTAAEARLIDVAIAPQQRDRQLRRLEVNTLVDLASPLERASSSVPWRECTMGRLPNSRLLPVPLAQRRPDNLPQLPVHAYREQIVTLIKNNDVIIVSGGTGCGKTTQIPQYLLEDCAARLDSCRIVVTQPRRLPAVAAAERVAFERGEQVGGVVGYHIRLERKLGPRTALTFCTPGVLLRTLHDPDGENAVSHIFLDEVHEREQHTDFLLALLRRRLRQKALGQRPTKLVLMSATLDADLELFERYFPGCVHLRIQSRVYETTNVHLDTILLRTCYLREEVDVGQPTGAPLSSEQNADKISAEFWDSCAVFGKPDEESLAKPPGPVQWDAVPLHLLSAAPIGEAERHLAESLVQRYQRDLQFSACTYEYTPRADTKLIVYLVSVLLDNPLPGSILIFLPGYEDISEITAHCSTEPQLHVLHSEMDTNNQRDVFLPAATGRRKVILSTNIAEASLTIEDVVFVIDCGFLKEKRFVHGAHISLLATVSESKTNAIQRSGRAGRCQAGWCFRLFTQSQYEQMEEAQQPEMQRSSIHELCLQARFLSPANESVKQFLEQCPQPPPLSAVADAIEYLRAIGCMKADESLTAQGRLTAELPLGPGHARALLMAAYLRCLDPVLQLVAMLSYRDPFLLPVAERRAEARTARINLASGDYSEHLIYLSAFQKCSGRMGASNNTFMYENYISPQNMAMARRIRNQLRAELERVGIAPRERWQELNRNASAWPLVKACLVAGAHPCIGFLRDSRRFNFIDTVIRDKVQLSQVLRRLQPPTSMGEHKINFVFFEELSEAPRGDTTARLCSLADCMYAALFAGKPVLPANLVSIPDPGCEERPRNSIVSRLDAVFIVDDGHLAFSCTRDTCRRLNWLRVRLFAGFSRFLSIKQHHGLDIDDVLNAVEVLLSNADLRADVDLDAIKLKPPDGCSGGLTYWQQERKKRSALCDPTAPNDIMGAIAVHEIVPPEECVTEIDKVKKWLETGEQKIDQKPTVVPPAAAPSRLRHKCATQKARKPAKTETPAPVVDLKPVSSQPTKQMHPPPPPPPMYALPLAAKTEPPLVDVTKPPPTAIRHGGVGRGCPLGSVPDNTYRGATWPDWQTSRGPPMPPPAPPTYDPPGWPCPRAVNAAPTNAASALPQPYQVPLSDPVECPV